MRPRYLIALFSLVLAFAAPSISTAATLTLSAPNCSDFTVSSNNGNVTLNCVAISTGSGAPQNCSLTSSANNVAPGTIVTLTASCSGGGAPTSFSWGGQGINASGPAQQSIQVSSTTTFTVTPSNGSGPGNQAQVTVNVTSGGGGGGGNAGGDLCSQYQNVVRMDVPWGGSKDTRSNGTPFLANGVLAVRFTVPAGAAYSFGALGAVNVSEFADGGPAFRQASLSTTACDFRGVATTRHDDYLRDLTGATAFPMEWATGNTASAQFTVTGTSANMPQLQPGGTYYYNVRNWSPFNNRGQGAVSCTKSTCNVIVQVRTP
jgi:hypothetical protein